MLNTSEDAGIAEEYRHFSAKKIVFLAALAVTLVVLCIFTIRLGSTGLTYRDIIHYLFHPDDSWNSTVIWEIRMPGIVAALLAGSALGIAGSVMQGILRNPMASPFTLGLSNASAFGAALAIMFLGAGTVIRSSSTFLTIDQPLLVTLFAFIFAMISIGVILLLMKAINTSPETIVLAGLAVSAIFSALLAFMQYIADDVVLSLIVFWQFGSLDKATWDNLKVIFVVLAVIAVYFYAKRWDYNAMEAGEDVAKGLGVKVQRNMIIGLVASAMLTAIVVSFMGVIGFIGLIGPHMIKRVIGNDFRYLLPGSMLMGSLVLLLSYVVGSYAFSMSIPVGIITSAIGGPMFIYILIRGHRKCSV